MKHILLMVALLAATLLGLPTASQAQDKMWVQIEAQPTLREAKERASAYTGVFPDVSGFQMASGWYAIALGPYPTADAVEKLASLRAERLVPSDSFLADGRNYDDQFWPIGGAAQTPQVAVIEPEAPTEPPADVTVVDPALPDETPAEARRSEAALSTPDRQALQTALQWFGFYASDIDGAFGPGTRKSMAAYQEANALEPTGILTTQQRADLLAAYGTAQSELGLQTVTEPESGIEITLPMALIGFDHYEPPFVHYAPKPGSDVKVILISQPGDQSTLYGLYDILQTLEAVPLNGERSRDERSFTVNARSNTVASYSHAELSKGLIKGYMLIWNPADDERMGRVLATMQSSFKPLGDRALDPGLVPMAEEQRQGLLSGLEIRRPAFSHSGFFVDATGMVLTTLDATQNCSRITLDLETDATVALSDPALGIALLKPAKPLSPAAVAELQTGPTRLGSEIAVAGYSYGDTLPAPSLTFGKFEAAKGLADEPGIARLTLSALPGDAGGPVLESTGAVLGMLQPRATDTARKLPDSVAYATSAATLSAKLAEAGIAPTASTRSGALAPEDMATLANGMTVLVSCWK